MKATAAEKNFIINYFISQLLFYFFFFLFQVNKFSLNSKTKEISLRRTSLNGKKNKNKKILSTKKNKDALL
jgi:hypothetical protein